MPVTTPDDGELIRRTRSGELAAFEYMKSRDYEQVQEMLEEAQMSGLTSIIMTGIEGLAGQAAPSGSALNDKFQKTGKFTMVRTRHSLTPTSPGNPLP